MGKSNVNPGQYKTAGRERQGEDVTQEQHTQEYAQAKAEQRKAGRSKSTTNPIPGTAPVAKAGRTTSSKAKKKRR